MRNTDDVTGKARTVYAAGAIGLTVGAGANQMGSAQPGRGSERGSMNWGNTNQFGVFEIFGVLIGIAVLTLLVALVVRVSRKSGTP